jgi:hypothetical protein
MGGAPSIHLIGSGAGSGSGTATTGSLIDFVMVVVIGRVMRALTAA